jgi:hypothetical protein
MMRRIGQTLALTALLTASILTMEGCKHIPPNLNPQATAAWYGTQVIRNLDLLRDIAQDGSATTPPVISIVTARKVTLYHESAIKTIHSIPLGWQSIVSSGLDELAKDLPKAEAQQLGPYIALAKTVIQEATR